MLPKALTIAGSDSGGGAGIQADLKTFQELDTFGMSVITAVTAQNTEGVQGVYPVESEGIDQQITSVMDDIGADAVKTGMLFDKEIIGIVAEKSRYYKWPNLVVDPVMVSTSGSKLLKNEAIDALINELIPQAAIITPNIPEAKELTGLTIQTVDDRKNTVKEMYKMGASAVLLKGGHEKNKGKVVDLFYDGRTFHYLSVPEINTPHTHGTGCTYAAAITANLAKGLPLPEAVRKAKMFIHAAIMHGFSIGKGSGPTNHAALRLYPDTRVEMEVETE
ncbi:bifunctional hydroxymethylpyrimidine kinase/phosphomethylpyrimidine kinase [Salipaludibacillus aurantiacus]|uniref:Hydroxymethylpyrimidine/phosphomethylpyrimidine kinase n=1 Tax=Salipaludibacillus aurantiacus TaxID=1601833 RepID=A0A1H9SGF8_9BACI|nr:bifunctional hydroxymethylpyrimidine kinase/phosphomethylpyrimidine kinase [Salipaludibacillus aurantiacus]SER83695.1 hydroxymethylpyrimidine/phosphomethylpyrimidine kinase [Salipaludibacillus aurantiacus]